MRLWRGNFCSFQAELPDSATFYELLPFESCWVLNTPNQVTSRFTLAAPSGSVPPAECTASLQWARTKGWRLQTYLWSHFPSNAFAAGGNLCRGGKFPHAPVRGKSGSARFWNAAGRDDFSVVGVVSTTIAEPYGISPLLGSDDVRWSSLTFGIQLTVLMPSTDDDRNDHERHWWWFHRKW